MADILLTAVAEGIVLWVRVQPRASRNKILGEHAGALKIALSAPPVDGTANQACIELLAKEFNLKKAQVEIKSGHKSRNKHILLIKATPEQLQEQLKRYH